MTRARWIAIASLAIAGCSLVNAPSDHTGGEISIDDWCLFLGDLSCRAHTECCPSPTLTYDECLPSAVAGCMGDYADLVSDPRVGYDPGAAAAAIARARALVDTCDVALVDWYFHRDGVQSAMTGTVAPGGVCTPRSLTPFDVPALYSCDDPAQSCQLGAPEWRCAPRVEVGGSCWLYTDCQDDLYCLQLTEGMPGTCRPRRADGDLCTEAVQCTSLVCQGGMCRPRDPAMLFCGVAAMP